MDPICALPSPTEGDASAGSGQEDKPCWYPAPCRGAAGKGDAEAPRLGCREHHVLLFCMPGQTGSSWSPGPPAAPSPALAGCLPGLGCGCVSLPPLVVCSVGVGPFTAASGSSASWGVDCNISLSFISFIWVFSPSLPVSLDKGLPILCFQNTNSELCSFWVTSAPFICLICVLSLIPLSLDSVYSSSLGDGEAGYRRSCLYRCRRPLGTASAASGELGPTGSLSVSGLFAGLCCADSRRSPASLLPPTVCHTMGMGRRALTLPR